MSTFQEMIDKDLELMWSIQRYCQHNKWIKNIFSRIVHKHPYRDICAIVWILFILGIFEVGANHFWVTMMNLAAVAAARTLIEAKRPVEYDSRLQPLTDINPDSYGFPSTESYISVIIVGHIFLHTKSFLFLPFGIAIILVVGFSRVYARSRFPHQIVASYILAIPGLFIAIHYCDQMDFQNMTDREHGFCVGFIGVCVACVFALSMENNDSRLLYIPKQEFMRVFVEILSSGKDLARNEGDDDDDEEEDQALLSSSNIRKHTLSNNLNQDEEEATSTPTPTLLSSRSSASSMSQSTLLSMHTARTSSSVSSINTGMSKRRNNHSRHVKSDSLYFLQKSLEDRAARKAQAQSTTAGGSVVDQEEERRYRRANYRSYGTEDFFSTDNDDDDSEEND